MAESNVLVVRFRVYAPNGDPLGVLPHPLTWEAGIPFNDMPSLTMTYPDGSEAAELLKTPCEVALELRNPNTGTFTEHPGCRFINIRRSYDLAARPRILSFTMPSYGWMLKKVRWMDPDNPRLTKEGQISYSSAVTPATPLVDMLDYAHARHNVPGLTASFTRAQDSNGEAWDKTVQKVTFDYGQDAWSILDSFARQGFFDWRINKRTLEIFKEGGALKRMLDTDTGVHIHSMLATTEEPVERTLEEVAGTVLAIGDNGLTAGMVTMPEDPEKYPWGLWDEAVSVSGVSDVQTLANITDSLLGTKYKARTQYTKRFTWTEGAPVPLADYRPGDFIRAMSDATTGAQKASMRVYQITLSGEDPYNVSIALTLNDRFTDRALQNERWVARVSGGGGPVGGVGTGGGSIKLPPPPIDSTPPKTPTLTTVTNEPYFSELGDPVSMADVAFQVVTQDINDKEIDVLRYNVAARRSDHNWQQARIVQVLQPDSPSTGQVIHGHVPLLDSGHTYEFRVQAIRRSGYTSEWSNPITQTMGYPTDKPPVPSKPLLSTKLSTVKVEWDGLDDTETPYEPQFRAIEVEASTDGTTFTRVGDIFSPGSSVILSGKGGLPTFSVGDTVHVRLRARNSAAVVSDPSEVESIVVQGVVGPDIQAGTITANEIAAGTLTAEQVKAHSLSVDRLAVGDGSNFIADPLLSDTESLNPYRLAKATEATPPTTGVWSIVDGAAVLTFAANPASSAWFGLYGHIGAMPPIGQNASLPSPGLATQITRPANASTGSGSFKARMRVVIADPLPGGSSVNVGLAARFYDRSGNQTANVLIISQNSFTDASDSIIESVTGVVPPVGSMAFIPYVWITVTGSIPEGTTVSVSQFEVWQEQSVFIGDGMIKAPLIAANAITTEKLDANAITAKHSIRSAYYEMTSQTGGSNAATVKITSNANFSGQSGIWWDGLAPSGGSGPRLFQVDASGSGGWDPRGFVICGPEAETNSSGRIDMQFAYGVTGSYISRNYGTETVSRQGIYWDTSVARLRIGGMFNTGHYTNDMFRMGRAAFQNGTYSYGVATHRRYYPFLVPHGGSSPVTSSIYTFPSGIEAGFRYVSSSGTTEVFWLAVCGTPS